MVLFLRFFIFYERSNKIRLKSFKLFMTLLDIISYGANIVFVTWGVVDWFAKRRERKDTANYLNAGYDMAEKLSISLGDGNTKGQADNIASFLKSATMNSMGMVRNELGVAKHSWLKSAFHRDNDAKEKDVATA